jgi:pSer/pThr/pTyr-binding forkhead associated (FHA) protein
MNCPNGHLSTSNDYCSVCGEKLGELIPGVSPQFETTAPVAPVELPAGPDTALATEPNPPDPSSSETPGAAWRVECRIFKEAGPEASTPGAPYESSTEITLKTQVTQIGRSSQKRNLHPEIACDWDDAVSHRHAKIELDADGNAFLMDVGSSNGTMLNGQLISANAPVQLKDGDRISIGGRTALIVRAAEKENPQIT